MNITVDIDKELKEATDARQVAVAEANKAVQARQAIITEVLKPHQAKLQQLDATRQHFLQEALRLDGAVKRLQSLKDKNNGSRTGKEKPRK